MIFAHRRALNKIGSGSGTFDELGSNLRGSVTAMTNSRYRFGPAWHSLVQSFDLGIAAILGLAHGLAKCWGRLADQARANGAETPPSRHTACVVRNY